jgi:hypothetical protein
MDECKNRAAGSLEWKDGEVGPPRKRENFEKFNKFMNDTFPRASLIEKAIAECTWDKLQNEIDAIKSLNRNYSRLIDDQSSEIDALKAEIWLCHGTLESRNGNIASILEASRSLKAENEKLRNVASEAIAAIGSAIDGRDVCFDTVIENLMVAMPAPDTKGERG